MIAFNSFINQEDQIYLIHLEGTLAIRKWLESIKNSNQYHQIQSLHIFAMMKHRAYKKQSQS